jgi:hypothetical protein
VFSKGLGQVFFLSDSSSILKRRRRSRLTSTWSNTRQEDTL